jgi:hypothetical protein
MAYCELEAVKSELGITTIDQDDVISAMIDECKVIIDTYCGRHFDQVTETRYFDGAGAALWIDDITTITSISLDEDGDGTYESLLVTSDYIAYPFNKGQYYRLEISNNSNYGGFASGVKKGVKIVGVWGYLTVPLDVVRAAKTLVIAMFNNRQAQGKQSETLGDYSYTLSKDTADDILKSKLSSYRIMRI